MALKVCGICVAMEDRVNWFGDLLIVGVLVCFHFMRH